MFISGLGSFFFGLLLGWIFYRTLRLNAGARGLAEIASIFGILGGAAVLALFKSDVLFGWYATGLLIGFVAYLILDLLLPDGKQQILPWRPVVVPPSAPPSATPPADAPDGGNAEVLE